MTRTAPAQALEAHPDSACTVPDHVEVEVNRAQSFKYKFCFRGLGDISRVRIPRSTASSRQDALWKHTCFEVFLMRSDGSYYEFNFAPSSQWAAYRFTAYRQGMAELNLHSPPGVDFVVTPGSVVLDATIDLQGLLDPGTDSRLRIALAAVIEDRDGRLYYWALAHPSGAPDFHHADGFVGVLTDNVV